MMVGRGTGKALNSQALTLGCSLVIIFGNTILNTLGNVEGHRGTIAPGYYKPLIKVSMSENGFLVEQKMG
jgi:hypothetical protein